MTFMRYLRLKKGLTQHEFGRVFGLSQSEVSNIERGKSRQIDASLAGELGKFYDHPIQELLDEIVVIPKWWREYLGDNMCKQHLIELKAVAKRTHTDETVRKIFEDHLRLINKRLKERNLEIRRSTSAA